MRHPTKTLLCTGVLLLLGVGCGAAAPSPEIANARNELDHAHNGETGRRNPAELLIAERTLRAAEQAQTDHPDTTEARDLAYISDRQTLLAEAHARTMGIGDSVRAQQADYQQDLETQNREARGQSDADQATMAASGVQIRQQSETIAQQRGEVADAEAARVAAEARATDAMARLGALAAVRETATETTITILGSLLFRSGGADLLSGASERLGAVADALNAQPERTITVEGFTDSRGSSGANQTLSQARADSVRAFLVSHGVDASRVRAVGSGQSRPVADNATAEGRANNRRVEIVLGPTAPPRVTQR